MGAVALGRAAKWSGSDVFNVLLQILDDGRLTDGQGRTVDFTQSLVLMTSNLRDDTQLRDFFRTEFLNRLDEVLTYKPLEPDRIREIVDVQLARLRKHLAEQEITLELTGAAKEALAKEGYDPDYGARPLKRVIQKRIQNLLADSILRGTLSAGLPRIDRLARRLLPPHLLPPRTRSGGLVSRDGNRTGPTVWGRRSALWRSESQRIASARWSRFSTITEAR